MQKLLAQAVEALADPPETCWEWRGTRSYDGYGWAYHEKRSIRAHRVIYRLLVGPIPQGMLVCHTCDNRLCVNPKHLFLGTHQDNTDDMIRKGRGYWPGPKHPHPVWKLSPQQVLAIGDDPRPNHVLAKEYGVSRPAIHYARKRAAKMKAN